MRANGYDPDRIAFVQADDANDTSETNQYPLRHPLCRGRPASSSERPADGGVRDAELAGGRAVGELAGLDQRASSCFWAASSLAALARGRERLPMSRA